MFILRKGGLNGVFVIFFLFSSASITIAEELFQVSEPVLLSNFIRHRPQKILIIYTFVVLLKKVCSEPDLLLLLFIHAIPL